MTINAGNRPVTVTKKRRQFNESQRYSNERHILHITHNEPERDSIDDETTRSGAMPVCDGDKLVGMITGRDIVISCVAAGMDAVACQAKEFMTSNPITVTPESDLEEGGKGDG